jgi:hypothetical protein
VILISSIAGFDQIANADSAKTSITLEQCHNGHPTLVDCDDPIGNQNNWGQGNANHNNASIFEDDSQNYRIIIKNLPANPDINNPYVLVFEQDFTKSGKMTQDFWTGPGNIQTSSGIPNGIHPCVDSKGNQNGYCDPTKTPISVEIPIIPPFLGLDETVRNVANNVKIHFNGPVIDDGMLLHGPVFLNPDLKITGFSGDVLSDSSIEGTLKFNTYADGDVVLYYGGHISAAEDYVGIEKETASQIPGSPYHNRLISFNGINGSPGKQDMQLMSAESIDLPILTIIKKVENNNGGTKDPSDFTIIVNANNPSNNNFSGSSTGTTITLGTGPYSVSELPETGYAATISSECSGIANEGDILTCTITNDDKDANKTYLTVIKNVVNDDGGSAIPDDFNLTVDGQKILSGISFEYPANTPLEISETQLSNYAFVSITGNAKCPTQLDDSLTLEAGDDVICIVTNDDVKDPKKIPICHIPAGDISKAFIIEVSPSSVNSHLNHGDLLNSCEKQWVGMATLTLMVR